MKKHIMKLRRVSTHSYAVTLPKELVKEFGWKEKQKLIVERRGKRHEIIIRDWKPPRPSSRALNRSGAAAGPKPRKRT